MLVDYFKSIFTLANSSNFDSILQGIESQVTLTMNAELTTKSFMAEEVEQAFKQMKSMTVPGPDGMPPFSYKSYWNTVSSDVISATLLVLNSSFMPPHINHAFISLIPKIKNPEKSKDFRPISLCNVIYKIIFKTISNCLKIILPKLVSKSQSAFMSNRFISDNILIAFETLHHLKKKRQGITRFMAL